MPLQFIKPVIDESVRLLCCRPYYNHRKGCPNYGKRSMCPPAAPLLNEFLDMQKLIMAVWVEFDLELHRRKLLEKHLNWTERQLNCCLYWQGKVNKKLRREVNYNLRRNNLFNSNNLIATYCPEAMGVNVTETMRNIGVILEWPPRVIVRKIAFIGTKAGDGKKD